MRKQIVVLLVLIAALVGMAFAANYMYEKATVKGVGYKNVEMIVSSQYGYFGAKLVEKESGSGNVIIEKTELEAERQLMRDYTWNEDYSECDYPTGINRMDYINFTKKAEFEYMPISYQTGTYDQKWIEKLCVQNYRIGAVLTEMYTHAEHLQKSTEVRTRLYGFMSAPVGRRPRISQVDNMNTQSGLTDTQWSGRPVDVPCCTGVLEANLNSNVIGVAHIGWMSREPMSEAIVKGRHVEYGRSVEDLSGVFSIEKFIQLWGNSTCGAITVDWLPCI